jgi:hypothetical protein
VRNVDEDPPAIAHSDPRSLGDRTPVVLDCEHALLGTLLRAGTVDQAASVLAAVADADFADPRIRDAVALVRAVVREGVLPAPSVLLARLTTERGTHHYKLMALLFVDAWHAGPPAIVAWPLVLAVLEASYRRAARRWADRLRQASDGPLDVLTQILSDNTDARAAWRRLATARRRTATLRTTSSAARTETSRRGGSSSPDPAWRARSA